MLSWIAPRDMPPLPYSLSGLLDGRQRQVFAFDYPGRVHNHLFGRQQANQTAAIEIFFDLVKRWPRYTEQLGGLGDRLPLGSHASKHLVSNLDQIARVEEITADKSRILNIRRLRICSAAALKSAQLGVEFRWSNELCK